MWQPGEHIGFRVFDEPGTPGWFELHTRDYERTRAFYREVLGWTTRVESDTADFRYTTLVDGDVQYAGVMDGTGHLPDGVPAHWGVYVRVTDTDAAVAAATALGATVLMGSADTPYGRLAVCADPTGAPFRLVGS